MGRLKIAGVRLRQGRTAQRGRQSSPYAVAILKLKRASFLGLRRRAARDSTVSVLDTVNFLNFLDSLNFLSVNFRDFPCYFPRPKNPCWGHIWSILVLGRSPGLGQSGGLPFLVGFRSVFGVHCGYVPAFGGSLWLQGPGGPFP